ncbi:MAG: hypothetical protein L6R40_000878 [Gallowayella cf. fulva]|nr:MAG: hypothetical protein L6R40_000878 [Xanthomendoza cf. fulva]
MHLEGALSPTLLFTLAHRNGINLPPTEDDPAFASPDALLDRYARFTSLDDFLHYYFIGMSSLIHAQDFEQLAWEYFQRAHSDGVIHAEVFFDPQAHTSRGIDYGVALDGFTKACRKAESEFGMTTNLILCFLRHLPVKDAAITFGNAKNDLMGGRLAGIGLDSSEKGFPPGDWQAIYHEAKKSGIKRTAHAGEEGPVEYIREAVEKLDVERIDHGIRLAEDEELMRDVAEKNIMVTLCPLSNVRLQCVQSVTELPIRKFLDAGVSFSINSDDPAYFGGYVLDNFCAVQEAFSLTVSEWIKIVNASIVGSWCEESRKTDMLSRLDDMANAHYGVANMSNQ